MIVTGQKIRRRVWGARWYEVVSHTDEIFALAAYNGQTAHYPQDAVKTWSDLEVVDIEVKAIKIDWSKPIQWSSTMLPEWRNAAYIGKDGSLRVVNVGGGSSVYQRFTDTGYPDPEFSLNVPRPYIRNAPPPTVWPKIVYLVAMPNGALHTAKDKDALARILKSNVRECAHKITEVVVYGPNA
jgi:hypothetical protein